MKSKYFIAIMLVSVVVLCACDSGKKGNLASKKNGTEDFVFKPPASPAGPTPSKIEPVKEVDRSKHEQAQ